MPHEYRIVTGAEMLLSHMPALRRKKAIFFVLCPLVCFSLPTLNEVGTELMKIVIATEIKTSLTHHLFTSMCCFQRNKSFSYKMRVLMQFSNL